MVRIRPSQNTKSGSDRARIQHIAMENRKYLNYQMLPGSLVLLPAPPGPHGGLQQVGKVGDEKYLFRQGSVSLRAKTGILL